MVSYENPSRLGPPLVYTTRSEVLLQRPDKLRVITPGDGPASEFYYDGKLMMAYAPAENLVAVAAAPPTIDAALQAAYDSAAIYFPFTDVIVADPYGDIAGGLQARLLHRPVQGRRRHDHRHRRLRSSTMCSCRSGSAPRTSCRAWRARSTATIRAQLRHQLELSNWKLDVAVPAGAFATAKADKAMRIKFDHPNRPARRGRQAGGQARTGQSPVRKGS